MRTNILDDYTALIFKGK